MAECMTPVEIQEAHVIAPDEEVVGANNVEEAMRMDFPPVERN